MIKCPRIKDICEDIYQKETGQVTSNIAEIVRVAKDSIFDFDYEIFDATYKSVIETKIIRHYYLRRTCIADYSYWKLLLENTMTEIMPYYNQFYKSQTLEINPLYNFQINVTHTDSGGDSLESTTDTNKSKEETTKNTENATDNTTRNLTDTDITTGEKTVGGTRTDKRTDTVDGTFTEESTSKNDSSKDGSNEINTTRKSDTSAGSTTQNEANNSRDVTDTSNSINKFSDTPQGRLTDVQSGTYLTDARVIDDTKNSNESSTNKGKELVTSKAVSVDSDNESGTNKETITETGSGSSTKTDKKTVSVEGEIGENRTENDKGSSTKTQSGSVNKTLESSVSGSVNGSETGKVTKNEELTTNRKYVEEVLGIKDKTQAELIMKYRESFLNIDMMVINALKELFDSRLYVMDYIPTASFVDETDEGVFF